MTQEPNNLKVTKGGKSVETADEKLSSIGSAIMVAQAILKQSQQDKEAYSTAFAENEKNIPDQRIKSVHKIPFNKNMVAYAETEKELEKTIVDLKEELDNEIQKNQVPSAGEASDGSSN